MSKSKTNYTAQDVGISEDEAIKIIMEDLESLTTEDGYYAIGAIGDDKFPLKELASLTQPKRVAWLKEIANGRKTRAEEAWKNGAVVTRITKSKEGSKIEQEFIPPPSDNEE